MVWFERKYKLLGFSPFCFSNQAAETEKLWVLCFIEKPENISPSVRPQ
jgi:hypothetical protein